MQVPRRQGTGTLALRGARLVTMKGDEVLERGDVLIRDHRIAAIGRSGSFAIPQGTRVIDVSGKTIVPGLVDLHFDPIRFPRAPHERNWPLAAQLAFGVTTVRNPAGNEGVLEAGELVETGAIVGSRTFSVSSLVSELAAPLESQAEADRLVRRYVSWGATGLKDYAIGRRTKRQWLIDAARRAGINATNEGYFDMRLQMSYVFDGYGGWEHVFPIVPVYRDVAQLLAQSGTTYTPTLIAGYVYSTLYMHKVFDAHDDVKQRRFMPPAQLEMSIRDGKVVHDEDHDFRVIAQGIRDIVRAGGRVGLGSHGDYVGTGTLWELWLLGSGGLTPHEVLRIATINGAHAIGFERDIGSLEVGKIADLLVLDRNPLLDIRHMRDLRYVMKGGEMFLGDTLDQVWPVERKFERFWWSDQGN